MLDGSRIAAWCTAEYVSRGMCGIGIETIESGKPRTGFMNFGDRIRIEMLDDSGRSLFGRIDQVVERYEGP